MPRTLHRSVRAPLFAACVLLGLLALAPTLRAAASAAPRVEQRELRITWRARSTSGTTTERALPIRADMLGATWIGSPSGVRLRARGADGRWSRWTELESGEDGPDPGSREARATRGRRALSVPLWVGDAGRVQVRVDRGVRIADLRLTLLNVSGTATRRGRAADLVRRSAARVLGVELAPPAAAMPANPGVRSRATWGASNARSAPVYADRAVGVVVHHTDTPNAYSCSEVPALLRGIQRYHENSLGWNDIGYNFVVDRCGGVWEGRGGGATRAVVGAHTMGFNTGTVGIALLGVHTGAQPSAAARRALARLIAWRLDVAHVTPTGTMRLTSRSSDKFPVGTEVTLPAVSGHRDLFPTACPGRLAYTSLGAFARTATATGGLKVANITTSQTIDPASGAVTSLRVRATSNSAAATVTVSVRRPSDGAVFATSSLVGRVAVLRMTRDVLAAPRAWDLRVRVEASLGSGQTARVYDEPLAQYSPDPGFAVTAPPAAFVQPGGEPVDDQIAFAYTLAVQARLGAWLYDPVSGAYLQTLVDSRSVEPSTVPVTEFIAVPDDLPDGDYELRVGVEDDSAPGRSMRRYPLRVTRATN